VNTPSHQSAQPEIATASNVIPFPTPVKQWVDYYAQQGLHPIELHAVVLGDSNTGKKPKLDGWTNVKQVYDPNSWALSANVGLRMGEQPDGKRLVAIDIDHANDPFPALFQLCPDFDWCGLLTARGAAVQRTPGNGWHIVVWWPAAVPLPSVAVGVLGAKAGAKTRTLAEGKSEAEAAAIAKGTCDVDIRGKGGQIAVAPSRHWSGGCYEWVVGFETVAPYELPEAVARGLLGRTKAQPSQGPAVDVVADQCRRVMQAAEGERNATLNAAAFAVGQVLVAEGLNEAEAVQRLGTVALKAGLLDYEAHATIRSGIEAGKAKPRQSMFTDIGNSERLVARIEGRYIYSPERRIWFAWDGTRWAPDNMKGIQEEAKKAAQAFTQEATKIEDLDRKKRAVQWGLMSESDSKIDSAISLSTSDPKVTIRADVLDANTKLLNCTNGTLDLMTGVLRPHDPKDWITKSTGVEFDPNAMNEDWDRLLCGVTGADNELFQFMQRAIGYTIQGDVTERAFFFIYGAPATGKSVFLGTIAKALGDYAINTSFETWLNHNVVGGNRGDLMRTEGARFVYSSEVKPGLRFDVATVKAFAGGDPITGAAKYSHERTFQPQATLWLGANDRPLIAPEDSAMWERAKIIPTGASIAPENQDKGLRQRLQSPGALQAVLAWSFFGLVHFRQHGLGTCAAVSRATSEYYLAVDPVTEFFEERIEWDPKYDVAIQTLTLAYQEWFRNRRGRPLSQKALVQRCIQRGAISHRTKDVRLLHGLRLIADSMHDAD